ncbi:kinase-like protein [Linnemannia elongata AG-77]|uniref:Kinase-like protein n=1 Tax=Linnemannia elongata AG-77 TaxID=1314771 RepID=A0A197JP38_9FUNG|nr:kinase-like protein [Linnemannia elongata AG-77]
MPVPPSLTSLRNPKAPHNITNPHVAILDSTSNNTNDSNTADQDHHLLVDPERRHQDQEQGHPGRSAVATALPSEPYSTLTDGEHPLIGWAHRRWSHQSPGSSSPKVDSSTIDKLSGSLENTLTTSLSKNNNNQNTRTREWESRLSTSLASTLSSVHESFAHASQQQQQQEEDATETVQTDRSYITPHTTATTQAAARPHISIDTSPVALQRRRSPATFEPLPFAHHNRQVTSKSSSTDSSNNSSAFSRHLSNNNSSNNTPSQLSLGFNPCRKTNMNPPTSILSSSVPKGLPTPSTTLSTPPKRRMSLSWNLPPGHPKEITTSSQSSTHALSSAVPILPVTSTDGQDHQTTTNNSHTPNIPFNRYRSKSFSSSVGSEDSFGSTFSSHRSNSLSTTPLVTSSSYSSLPYSPAVAFLSNFVDVTAPKISLDEEGAQVGEYLLGRVIGHGGFSIVREATSIHMDESGQVDRVAVKIVKTQTGAADNDRVQNMLRKEIAIWSQISHPHVLPFLSVEELPTDTFIFCELCTGGHLLNYLSLRSDSLPQSTTPTTPGSAKPLEEDEARVIFNQVAEAVRYLHEEKRIVHRDIKLENVLRHEDGTWKICDFGLAEYQDEEAAACFGESLMTSSDSASAPFASPKYGAGGTTPVKTGQEEKKLEEEDICGGSLAYSSPEQLRSHKPLRCPSSDVWSLGVVLYALLTGRLPFQDEYEPRLQYQILNGRYEDPAECSAEARDLLKNMFRSKPEERWRVGQVKDSAWCKGITDHSLSVGGDFSIAGGAGGGGGGSSFLSSFRSTL